MMFWRGEGIEREGGNREKEGKGSEREKREKADG